MDKKLGISNSYLKNIQDNTAGSWQTERDILKSLGSG
jgi:hypothetical protein